MRTSRRILVVGVMVVLATVALAGCHGGGSNTMRFVNESDSAQVVEFKMQNPNVMARVHMAVFNQRVKGSYTLKNADKTDEGRVVQDEKGYVLESKDGKKQRFEPQPSGGLKDDMGATWKLDNPTNAVVVKELKRY